MKNECMKGVPYGQDAAAFTDDQLMNQLGLLAAGCRQNSMTARLVAVIDLIETLLSRGYDRSQVREALIEVGWLFTPDSFDSALSRVRKRRVPASASEMPLHSKVDSNEALLGGGGASGPTSGDPVPSMAEIFATSIRSHAMRR